MPTPKLTPCLWFNTQAEDAAKFYCSIFPDSRITETMRYGDAGKENHGRPPGSVMMVAFDLAGQHFTALNGGPQFKFSEAISFQIPCKDQAEIDRYWTSLLAGGGQPSQCGWLKDKFGLSWQIFPEQLPRWLGDQKSPASQRAMLAMMSMSKIDLATIKKAYEA